MNASDLERLVAALVPGSGPAQIQPIGAGLVSETYRIVRDDAKYSLRLPLEESVDARLDRRWEAAVQETAARVKLAPPVLCSEPNGILLSRWMEGRCWSPSEAQSTQGIRKLAELLRRVHGLKVPIPTREGSPSLWVKIYAAALAQRGAGGQPALRTAATLRLAQLAKLPSPPPVLCHSDLHTLNLLETADSLILLDWEYAHLADPLWDLAGWSANNDLGDHAQQPLLREYLGAVPTPGDNARFKLLLWLYDYVCLLWGELYLNLGRGADRGVMERTRQLDARLHDPAHYQPAPQREH